MAFLSLLLGAATLAAVLYAALHFFLQRSTTELPLPPGPKPLPLIGNVHQLPTAREWLTFKQWGDQYGDVCCATVFGQPMIILNSAKAISDIMEKRAAAYAGRPRMIMAGELVGTNRSVAMIDDLDTHKQYRKLFNQALNPRAAQDYWPSQLKESREMMARLLDTPDQLEEHIKQTVIAVIFLVSHGYQIESNEDPYVWLGNKVMVNFAKAAAPGAYLVDFLPFLRYVPEWMPGAGFRREANLWRSEWFQSLQQPFDMVKAHVAAGTARRSFASNLLEKRDSIAGNPHKADNLIMWTAGSLYSAGADTSVSAIQTFFLAMMQFPEVQAKAQAEVDNVVGRDRMPTFEDKDRLVYCDAIIKETLRWQPVAPLAIPHTVHEDDVYNGYRIPKGSMVIGNIWATMNDPSVYPSPEKFIPERFLSADGKTAQNPEGVRDIGSLCFGFGRRICPGANIAEASLYAAVVNTLWTFNISKPIGTDGKPIEPDMEYVSGVVSHPKTFACDIKPRSGQAAELVRHAVAEYRA